MQPRHNKEDQINAARMLLPKCIFDADNTLKGLEFIEKLQTQMGCDKQSFFSHAASQLGFQCR